MMSLSNSPPLGRAPAPAYLPPLPQKLATRLREHGPYLKGCPPWWALGLALCAVLLCTAPVHAQGSEDPSDATPSLNANVTGLLFPALSATCVGGGVSNGPFSMASVASVTNPTLVPYAPCAYSPAFPLPPAPPKDIWFRLNPAFADAVYRFTLIGTGSPAMVKGGIALYAATTAAGPFRLLSCSSGGSTVTTMASAEATGLVAGEKIYVRIWDYTPDPSSNFNICIVGQRLSNLVALTPDRGADETPCTARTITAVALLTTSGSLPSTMNFVWATEEPGFLVASQDITGGDLWVKLQVPATGNVNIKLSFGTVPANQVGTGNPMSGSLGASAYLASNCSDFSTFIEVGSHSDWSIPSTTLSGLGVWPLRCLPPNAWVYVRFYSLKSSVTKVKRFGQFRFEWMNGPNLGTPPANCNPCGAVDLPVSASCPGTTVTGGNTSGSCSAPGIPPPSCGGFNDGVTPSVWHKFTAPLSGTVQIDAMGTAPTPISPAIALYTSNNQGCEGRMALIACDDRQGPGPDARIIKWGLVPGQTYYIRTWSRTTDGTFSLCISEPVAPAGSCLYMVDLWREATSGSSPSMSVSINGGPATIYTPSGGDPSQTFLVPIPIGATADFAYTSVGAGYFFYSLWQVGRPDSLWWYDGGYAVTGPAPTPRTTFHLTNACNTISPYASPGSDCFGMKTICISNSPNGPPTYTAQGQMDNRPLPRHKGPSTNAGAYSNYGSSQYNGYTYNQANGNTYDLAGANLGCLDPEKNGMQWLVFHPQANGTVAFLLDAAKVGPTFPGPVDLDFAIWDLGSLVWNPHTDTINGDLVCPPRTAPIRCSSARLRGSTGLVEGMTTTQEGRGGWGWLMPLPVLQDHGYLIAIMPVDTIGVINWNLNWTLYKNAANASDPSIISCDPLVLPVELLFLAGVPEGNAVHLTWATASEKNSSRFVVERSSDAVHFTSIGQVTAAGNSQYRIDYSFMDRNPMGGVNYYRLKLVDRDGSTDLSNTVAVYFTGDGTKVVAWPNPTQDLLHVGGNLRGQAAIAVQVMDALGRVVQEQQITLRDGDETVTVGVSNLARGSYIVRLSGTDGGLLGTARFMKE